VHARRRVRVYPPCFVYSSPFTTPTHCPVRYARSRSRGSAAHPFRKAPTVDRTLVRTAPGMAGVAWLVLPYVWSQGMGRDQGLPGVAWRRGGTLVTATTGRRKRSRELTLVTDCANTSSESSSSSSSCRGAQHPESLPGPVRGTSALTDGQPHAPFSPHLMHPAAAAAGHARQDTQQGSASSLPLGPSDVQHGRRL